MQEFEKIFKTDSISKRQRVELTLRHKPVDRVAILEQLSYNPGVISLYTGKKIDGYNYTPDDICEVIRQTTDMIMPPVAPRGTERVTTEDGFVVQHDNWSSWHVSRPFSDVAGARDWLVNKTKKIAGLKCNPGCCWMPGADKKDLTTDYSLEGIRRGYQDFMLGLQQKIGDTVILNYSTTGMCSVFDSMGLELFTYFYIDYPEVMMEFMDISVSAELRRIHAIADKSLSPVILIPEDFSTKGGPIFGPDFLKTVHYPYLKKLVDAWHEHDIKVLYHSDGNYNIAIPGLMACNVDGFYCLEPACGMDIVELKNTYPQMVWAGGVDGVELMERGTPQQVKAEVRRQILESGALQSGGMFVATSSEINPPIKPENFKAMVEAVGSIRNAEFGKSCLCK
ncbi:MAG: uroporphyrinogen decarboxylase family protein [Sedimentisphaerales bacterium]